MGLLDQFTNMGDDQSMGLLSAGLRMMAASGPSRTPINFGQVALDGLQGYNGTLAEAKKRKEQEEQFKQLAQLRGLQIQEAQGGLQDHQLARDQANQLRDFYTKRAQPAQQPSGMAPQTDGALNSLSTEYNGTPYSGDEGPEAYRASQRAGMNGYEPHKINQVMALARQGLSVDQAAASVFRGGKGAAPQGSAQVGAGQAPLQQPAGSGGKYQQRLAEAQDLRNAGFHQQADAAEAAALKFQPKVKNWQEVRAGGRVLYAPFYEDGTSGQPVPLEIARKLEFQNLGGRTAAVDPYTGKEAVSFARSQTPDSIASNAVTMRGQNMTDARAKEAFAAPQYMETQDGIMALPKRLAPGATPTGQLVLGPNGQPLEKKQNIPQYVVQGVANNAKSLSSIDAALASLQTPTGKDAVGYKGYLPNSVLNRAFPDGTETRANIADVGSLILHDRSGAAVTASESPRLLPFIPLATDDAATAVKKLTRFRQLFQAETNNLTFAYPGAKKLADYAAQNGGGDGGQRGASGDLESRPAQPAPAGKTMSLSDIAATARASGKSTAEVTKAARAAGYTIGGQ